MGYVGGGAGTEVGGGVGIVNVMFWWVTGSLGMKTGTIVSGIIPLGTTIKTGYPKGVFTIMLLS